MGQHLAACQCKSMPQRKSQEEPSLIAQSLNQINVTVDVPGDLYLWFSPAIEWPLCSCIICFAEELSQHALQTDHHGLVVAQDVGSPDCLTAFNTLIFWTKASIPDLLLHQLIIRFKFILSTKFSLSYK